MEQKEKFVYGLSKFEFGGKTLGYIEKDSFDWGGQEADTIDVNAEQVSGQPVKTIIQSNGKVEPTFNLIQLDADNLVATLGGTATDGKWSAPTELAQPEGAAKITTFSGHVIEIPSAVCAANLEGKLALSEVAKIKVTLKVQQPSDGSSPLTIDGVGVTSDSGSSTSTTQAG